MLQKSYKVLVLLFASISLLTTSCTSEKETSIKPERIEIIDFANFESKDSLKQAWKYTGYVDTKEENANQFLRIRSDNDQRLTEWYAKIPLDSSWRRVRVTGKVRIPSVAPKPQFGKAARLYTAFYSKNEELLNFIGDISRSHLTWRYPFDEWEGFEFEFNIPTFMDAGSSAGNNRMELRFQLNEVEGEVHLDDVLVEAIALKPKRYGKDFEATKMEDVQRKEAIGSTITIAQEAKVDHFLYVDVQHKSASDANEGSENQPFKTLKKALSTAIQSNLPTKIILKEGTYVEENQIVMKASKNVQPLLIIEGEGDVKISGSVAINNWEKTAEDLYETKWDYNFGDVDQVWSGNGPWGNAGFIQPPGLRKELLFVNNQRLQQVFSVDALANNSFYIDDENEKVLIKSSINLTDASTLVEAGIYGDLLNVTNRSNMLIRNIDFVKAAKFIPFGSVEFSYSNNILIEDCKFLHNNSTALLFNFVEHITVKNCITNYNGWNGMKFEYAKYILSQNNECSYNGWRGNMGGFNGWDLAANKNFNTHHFIIDGFKAYDNRGNGLWFDWCNYDITIKNADIVSNHTIGLYFEASQGPAIVDNCRVAHNGEVGVEFAEAWNLTIKNSKIYDNQWSQLEMRARLRSAEDNYSYPVYEFTARNLKTENNIFSSTLKGSYLLEPYSMRDSSLVIFKDMIRTYKGLNNTFYHSEADTVFSIERHKYTDVNKYDRLTRGGRKTLEYWTNFVVEENAVWEDNDIQRIKIEGLPHNNTFETNKEHTLSLKLQNIEEAKLNFGIIKINDGKDKFKYFLNEFTPIRVDDTTVKLPKLDSSNYAIVAFAYTKDAILIQSNRIDITVQ